MSFTATAIRQLRLVGLVEGVSFLVLLGIAMPLKYLAGMPRVVSWVGMIHGVLFIAYLVALGNAWAAARWSIVRAAGLLLASILPFGTFIADPGLKREQAAAAAAPRTVSAAG